MYIYIDIFIVSILFAILYVVYSKYILHKNKREIIILCMIAFIIVLKVKSISSSNFDILCMISQAILLYTVCKNYTSNGIYKQIVVYISCLNVMVEILRIDSELLFFIRNVLNIIINMYILKVVIDFHIIHELDRIHKKKDIYKKGKKDISSYKKKLLLNKTITQKLKSNLDHKKELIESIIGEDERCMFIMDFDGNILSEDENFYKIWGYKESDKPNINKFLKTNIKDKSEFMNSIEWSIRYREEVKTDIRSKDGRFFKVIFTPLKMNHKESIICSFVDVTYNKQNEIKTEENNIKYRKIIETIPYNILITEENNILYNSKSSSIDFNEHEIKSVVLNDSIIGEVCYSFMNEKFYINIDRADFKDENTYKKLVVIKDITNYKKSIEVLKASKEKYKAFVNIIPEGIYLADYSSKNIIYKNKAFLDIFKRASVREEDVLSSDNILISSNKNNDEVVFNRKNLSTYGGEELNIEIGKKIIDINNEIKEIGIVRDITESIKIENIEREIEATKIANKIKTEFFVNMSHELKTPLNVITSSIQLLEYIHKDSEDIKDNTSIRESINIIKKNTYMLMNLINNVIDLAKLESKFHESDVNNYNIVNIVEETCEEFNKYLIENNINILFDTNEEEIVSMVDDDDIERVILTLLSIIIRYSYQDSTIYVNLNREGNRTNISIKNKDRYNHYKYINDQDKSIMEIGLKVTENIIELYNGDISVNRSRKNGIEINLNIENKVGIYEYKERRSKRSENFIYTEYVRMCNF